MGGNPRPRVTHGEPLRLLASGSGSNTRHQVPSPSRCKSLRAPPVSYQIKGGSKELTTRSGQRQVSP